MPEGLQSIVCSAALRILLFVCHVYGGTKEEKSLG